MCITHDLDPTHPKPKVVHLCHTPNRRPTPYLLYLFPVLRPLHFEQVLCISSGQLDPNSFPPSFMIFPQNLGPRQTYKTGSYGSEFFKRDSNQKIPGS